MSVTPLAAEVVAYAHDLTPRCGDTTVIAIDGRAGSGKSTLARAVGDLLGCPVVSLEGLYPGWDGLLAGITSLGNDVLRPIATHGHAAVPQYDWVRDAPGDPVSLIPGPLLVVEGVGAGSRAVAEFVSLLVWLDLDASTRRARALARAEDGAAFAPQWDRWAAQEEHLLAVDDIPARAHLRLSTDLT